MWIVKVTNYKGRLTNGAEFETRKEANDWAVYHQSKGSFGHAARVGPKYPITYPLALVKKEIEKDGEPYVKLNAEYTIDLFKEEDKDNKSRAEKYMMKKISKIREEKDRAQKASDFLLVVLNKPKNHRKLFEALDLLSFTSAANLASKLTLEDISQKDMDIILKFLED